MHVSHEPPFFFNFSSISAAYNESVVLRNVSFSLNKGEWVTLLGSNGSGKTCVLKLACGLLRPLSGNIFFKQMNLAQMPTSLRAKYIAYVPQHIDLALGYSVKELVSMGRMPHQNSWSENLNHEHVCVQNAMIAMDLNALADREASSLSGGQKKRVSIAMALAQEPELILLDEPDSSLDLGHKRRLYHYLKQQCLEKKMALILATHDLDGARRLSHKVVVLQDGIVMKSGPPCDVLCDELFEKMYNTNM